MDIPLTTSQSTTVGQNTTTKSAIYPSSTSPLLRDNKLVLVRPLLVSSNPDDDGDGRSSTTPRNSIRFHTALREGRKASLILLLLPRKTKVDEVDQRKRNRVRLELPVRLSSGFSGPVNVAGGAPSSSTTSSWKASKSAVEDCLI